jgi:hypothetical protein
VLFVGHPLNEPLSGFASLMRGVRAGRSTGGHWLNQTYRAERPTRSFRPAPATACRSRRVCPLNKFHGRVRKLRLNQAAVDVTGDRGLQPAPDTRGGQLQENPAALAQPTRATGAIAGRPAGRARRHPFLDTGSSTCSASTAYPIRSQDLGGRRGFWFWIYDFGFQFDRWRIHAVPDRIT